MDKVVVLSGAGLSAESGLPTFRDAAGLWNEHSWHDLASPQGWKADPATVLAFYNERRLKAWNASPNAAHRAIAALESAYDVVVVTQNIDELHERAGSTKVLHLHGQIAYARGTSANARRYRIEGSPILLGQLCEDGTQLRPDVVWFGEDVQHMDEARHHVATAAKVMVVGTSLSVQPAASLATLAPDEAEKVLISLDIDEVPPGFTFIQGNATAVVTRIAEAWRKDLRKR